MAGKQKRRTDHKKPTRRSKLTAKKQKQPVVAPKTPEKPPEKKKRPLNIRERKLVKALLAGKCPTDAMRAAGYAESTAVHKPTSKVAESRVQETIQALMERRGLTDDRLLEVMQDGIKATTVKIATDKGIITDEHVYDDHATRHKYLETGLKLKGHLRDKIELSNPDGSAIFSDLERANRLQHLIELAKKRAGKEKK